MKSERNDDASDKSETLNALSSERKKNQKIHKEKVIAYKSSLSTHYHHLLIKSCEVKNCIHKLEEESGGHKEIPLLITDLYTVIE